MGPLWGPEFPKISWERLQKTGGFTPAAARLIAVCLKSKNGTHSIEIVLHKYRTLEVILSVINHLGPNTTPYQTKKRLDAQIRPAP